MSHLNQKLFRMSIFNSAYCLGFDKKLSQSRLDYSMCYFGRTIYHVCVYHFLSYKSAKELFKIFLVHQHKLILF